MLKGCKLHHFGYTVADMQATIRQFSHFGFQPGPLLYDSDLQVEICYLTHDGRTSIELIHQLNEASLESRLLQTNGVMPYHIAYETDEFEGACSSLDALGYHRLFDPVPVKALGGIRICYFHHDALGYIEILESLTIQQ